MKALLIIYILCIASDVQGQNRGIAWNKGLDWQQIIDKAKKEKKYIFLDSYATWCYPCKLMDSLVFSTEEAGKLMTEKFISVKVQMDTSLNDTKEIKEWYNAARQIRDRYTINSYPTFLFFSPEGTIVHKAIGRKKLKDFISVAEAAADPGRQYYTLINSYKERSIKYEKMLYLAKLAKSLGDEELSEEVARSYISGFMNHLSDSAFYTKENIEFAESFHKVLKPDDKFFIACFSYPSLIDNVIGIKDYAKGIAYSLIYQEEVAPKFQMAKATGKTPNWNVIKRNVVRKYSKAYVENTIINAKVKWYYEIGNMGEYATNLVKRVTLSGISNMRSNLNSLMYLNNNAWEVFQHSSKKSELKHALEWATMAVAMDSNFQILDTKANILYKLGRKTEAIELMEIALKQIIDTKAVDMYRDSCLATIAKMKNNEPTWVVSNAGNSN